jgi:carbon monoxide dehydrogenase subunit G
MQIEQQFELSTSPLATWPAFQDIELLVSCLPGASLTGPAVDGVWPLRFDVKLGPIAAAFAGSGRVTLDDATHSGRFEGSAADQRTQSRVKGAADFALTAGGAGTVVQVKVDYALTGSLAQFSRGGIVRELAGALTAQFAANLAQRLTPPARPGMASTGPESEYSSMSRPDSADSVDTPAQRVPATASKSTGSPPSTANSLSATGLIALALRRRWQQLLAWLLRPFNKRTP